MQITWIKCQNDKWCPLETVDLTNVTAEGVYIIWHGGSPGRVVRVGQGKIADRLKQHKADREIMAYIQHGLYVTWASVALADRGGVERYLANHYRPLVGDCFPDVIPIVVNLP